MEGESSGSVLYLKFVTQIDLHCGQAGDSQRDPESRNFKYVWIPPFAGMTEERRMRCLTNFGYW